MRLVEAAADKENLPDDVKATHSILTRWLQQLHEHLLHKEEWMPKEIHDWMEIVEDIQKNWVAETHIQPFPKLHMLRHSLEFAQRHRFLGRASEAQIESFHFQFNDLLYNHHHNKSHEPPERMRRALSDTTLRAVQPAMVRRTLSDVTNIAH